MPRCCARPEKRGRGGGGGELGPGSDTLTDLCGDKKKTKVKQLSSPACTSTILKRTDKKIRRSLNHSKVTVTVTVSHSVQ